MLTYKHAKHTHTVTAEDHETTKQAILVRSGWVLTSEPDVASEPEVPTKIDKTFPPFVGNAPEPREQRVKTKKQ